MVSIALVDDINNLDDEDNTIYDAGIKSLVDQGIIVLKDQTISISETVEPSEFELTQKGKDLFEKMVSELREPETLNV